MSKTMGDVYYQSVISRVKFKGFNYSAFCLNNKRGYFELYFNDMKSVLDMNGMDEWPKLLDESDSKRFKIIFSLVAIDPQKEDPHDKRHAFLISMARGLARQMFSGCFGHGHRDNQCSIHCLANFPMIGIYMTVMDKKMNLRIQRRREQSQRKSIFDSNQKVHCISAVNYF
jgi:hypothetical protein